MFRALLALRKAISGVLKKLDKRCGVSKSVYDKHTFRLLPDYHKFVNREMALMYLMTFRELGTKWYYNISVSPPDGVKLNCLIAQEMRRYYPRNDCKCIYIRGLQYFMFSAGERNKSLEGTNHVNITCSYCNIYIYNRYSSFI